MSKRKHRQQRDSESATEYTESNGPIGTAINAAMSLPNAMAQGAEEFEKAAPMMAMESAGKDDTTFRRETTGHGNAQNGQSGLPLMSEAGKALASKTAPASAFVVKR